MTSIHYTFTHVRRNHKHTKTLTSYYTLTHAHQHYKDTYSKGNLRMKCIPFFHNIPNDVLMIIGNYLNEHECNIFSLLTGF